MPSSTHAPATGDVPAALPGDSAARKARFWNRTASQYAAAPIADLPGYEATLRRVQAFLGPDHTVLELGCGTGSTALRLAPGTRRWRATDVSTAMIDIARRKLAATLVPQLSFAVADADDGADDAAPSGGYDAVLAFNLLHLVPDLDHTLAVAKQALRPGGLLVSKTACIAELNPLIRWLALPLMQAIGRAPDVLVFDAAALEAALVRQGLDIVTIERHGSRGKDFRVFIVARKPA